MPPDTQTWLALTNQYGLPLVFMLSCFGGVALFIIRYAWPFITKEVWPFYLQREKERTVHDEAERARLITSIDTQRTDAIGAIDRIREAFSIQLESRSQELMTLTRDVANVTSAVAKLTEAVNQLSQHIEAMRGWDGATERRRK